MTTSKFSVSEQPESLSDTASDAARRSLRESPYASLWDVRCVGRDGEVVLRGRVPSFYMKQLAQELVLRTEGVRGVVNDLQVDNLQELEGEHARSV